MNKKSIITILFALVTMTGQAQSQQQEEQNQDTTINNEMNAILTESKQNTSNPTLFRQNIYKIVNGIIEKHPNHIASSFLIDWCKSSFTPTQALGLHGEAIEKKLAELFEPFDEEISK